MGIEFYIFENELWCRLPNGTNERLTEESRDVIKSTLARIESFHPKAYKALAEHYKKCQPNIPFFQFRIVNRFCRCNFGAIDNTPDIDAVGRFNFERVLCPLRGESQFEDVVCNPEFDSKISDAEMRVLALVFKGHETEEIADRLCLSIHTVNNHRRNAYTRIGAHEKADFIDYAHRNKLFKE